MSEENAQLYEEAQRRLREVTTLYEASQACLSISDQESLLTAIIEAAARATDAALGSVMLVDEEKGQYVFGAHYGLSEETIAAIEAELHIPLEEGLVGPVVTMGQPLVVGDVTTDPRWIPTEIKELMRSFLGVPLVGRDGQPLGALSLACPEVGAFDEDHARLLSTFANQAALAIENARLYEQAQARSRYLETLQQINATLRSTLPLGEVLTTITQGAGKALNYVGSLIVMPDASGERLTLSAVWGNRFLDAAVKLTGLEVGAFSLPLTAEENPIARAYLSRELHAWSEGTERIVVGVEPSISPKLAPVIARTMGARGAACLPLPVGEKVVGVLVVFSPREQLSDEERAMLLGLADQAGLAIENAWLYEQARQEIAERKRAEQTLQQRTAQLGALRQVGLELTAQLDLDVLLHSIVSQAVKLLGGTSGGLYLYRPERDMLEWTVTIGPHLAPTGAVLRRGEGLSGKVWESGEPLIVGDYQHWEGRTAIYEGYPFKAVVGVPVRWGEEFLGVLNVLADSPWTFSQADAELLSLFATQAAIAIRNARLYEQAQQEIVERKRAEEELRESEEKFRTLAEQSPNMIFINKKGRVVYANKKCEEIMGYKREEFCSHDFDFLTLIAPESIDFVKANFNRHMRGEEVPPFEYTLITKEGKRIEAIYATRLIRYEGERAILGTVTDITERKRAEEALQESQERFRSIFENAVMGLYRTTPDGRILMANPALVRMLGYSSFKELAQRNLEESGYEPEYPHSSFKQRIENEGQVIGLESAWVKRDGTTLFLRESARAIRDEAGNTLYYEGTVEDITERKQAEEALRQRNRELTELNAIIAIITATLELDQVLQGIVESVARLFPQARGATIQLLDETTGNLLTRAASDGLSAGPGQLTFRPGEGIVGLAIAERRTINVADVTADPHFIPGPAEPSFRSLLVAPLLFGEHVLGTLSLEGNLPMAFGDEDERLVQLLAKYAAIAVENARLFAAEQQRTAELGRALEQQQELDRLKSEFIQNVSHELRTPLSIARGYAGLLDNGELGELQPDQRESVDIIARRLRMLSKIVDDLIAILEAEAQELSPEPVDLVNLVHTLLGDFQVAAEQAGLSLAAEVASDVPQVSGDRDHLHRVLDNLLHNALKFTPAGGSVTVRLWRDGMNVVLEVTDTGIGIPYDQLGRIFERFYQVNGSTTRRYDGTGLGLALVKEIVEAHGGKVGVESKVGQGSTFKVYLPIASHPVEDTAPK